MGEAFKEDLLKNARRIKRDKTEYQKKCSDEIIEASKKLEDLEKIDELLSFSNVYALGNGENVEVDRIITLSTCSGNGTGDRKIVQAYLFDEYKIKN